MAPRHNLSIDCDNRICKLSYLSIVTWCLDNGYNRQFEYIPHIWNPKSDFAVYTALRNGNWNTVLSCSNDTLVCDASKVWIDDEELWVVRPKFEYYNSKLKWHMDRQYKFNEISDWLKTNFAEDDYHVYYQRYGHNISFRYRADAIFYKMVFLSGG